MVSSKLSERDEDYLVQQTNEQNLNSLRHPYR